MVADQNKVPPSEEIERWLQDTLLSFKKIRKIHYTQISLEHNVNIDVPLNLLVAGFIDERTRCMNCFKEFDEIKIINYTAFCEKCAKSPDFDKVDAFYRLNEKE